MEAEYRIPCPKNISPAELTKDMFAPYNVNEALEVHRLEIGPKDNKRYPCVWRVIFKLKNVAQGYNMPFMDAVDRDKLKRKIGSLKPRNTDILSVSPIKDADGRGQKFYEVEYGILCECEVDSVFPQFTNVLLNSK